MRSLPRLEPAAADRRAQLNRHLTDTKPATVPIMRELPADKHRMTKIQHRGNFLDLGPRSDRRNASRFPPLPEGRARNRLTLARWLMDDNNPLTARVLANRYWEQIFGIGIVSSSEEFGSQGDQPFHPELLDWLATELVRSRWDVKAFLKLLVTSAAYRQSSRVTPELEQRDPDNRLLARGPRFRLSAEVVRDQALAVSGLLSSKMYGPPVKPMQPSFGLNAAFGGGIDWQTSAGERPLSARTLHHLAPFEPLPVDGDFRRAQPRSLHGAPRADQYAAASPRDLERSRLCRGGPSAGPADRVGGRQYCHSE